MKNKISQLDLSIPRRRYFSTNANITNCPECKDILIKDNCTILLHVESDNDIADFFTNKTGSIFCNKCPVVVFDIKEIELAARAGIKSEKINFAVLGIANLDAIPEDKRDSEIGTDDNPLPLVKFLPDLKVITQGRNDLCNCGSGKKFKKCCG